MKNPLMMMILCLMMLIPMNLSATPNEGLSETEKETIELSYEMPIQAISLPSRTFVDGPGGIAYVVSEDGFKSLLDEIDHLESEVNELGHSRSRKWLLAGGFIGGFLGGIYLSSRF